MKVPNATIANRTLRLITSHDIFRLTIWTNRRVVAQGAQSGSATIVPLIMSELRFRSPNGPSDEFVEIYNNSELPHTVNSLDGSSSGYALVGSSNAIINDNLPATRFVYE